MKILAYINIEIDQHTVLAEIATSSKRPELRKLCQAILANHDCATLEVLRTTLHTQEIVLKKDTPYEERFGVQLNDRALSNLLQLLSDLELISDSKLTQIGRQLCDDYDAKVPIAEYGAYQLGTFHHEACGLQVVSLHRISTQEIRGQEFQTLQNQSTYELDPLQILRKNTWYETILKPQRFKFLSYAGGEPRCIQHPTTHKYIRFTLSGIASSEPTWQLVSSPNDADGPNPKLATGINDKSAAIIDSILLHAPLGKWDGSHLAVEFNATNESQRKSFEADFTIDEIETVTVGHVVKVSCMKIPLRPASQEAANCWIKDLSLNQKLLSPITRSQFLKLMEANLAEYENRFNKLQTIVPTNFVLAQALLAKNDLSKLTNYWNLQAPIDLSPLENTEPDSQIDLFAQGHRRNGRLAKSTGLTIEHHQLLEYSELLEALWDETEIPTEILICDRHMFANPQSQQLPKLLEAIHIKWPNCKIELWYSESKENKNNLQLIQDCSKRGHKVQTIKTQLSEGKIHDRFILLKCPSLPMCVWGASNTLLSPKQIQGKLRWPQVSLSRMKPEQTHTEIRNWAK